MQDIAAMAGCLLVARLCVRMHARAHARTHTCHFEGVLDISHIAHLSVQYNKYCTLILVKTFQDIITYL